MSFEPAEFQMAGGDGRLKQIIFKYLMGRPKTRGVLHFSGLLFRRTHEKESADSAAEL